MNVRIKSDGHDLFAVAGGVTIAKRGKPHTAEAGAWISLEPGWAVLDVDYPSSIDVMHDGVQVHRAPSPFGDVVRFHPKSKNGT